MVTVHVNWAGKGLGVCFGTERTLPPQMISPTHCPQFMWSPPLQTGYQIILHARDEHSELELFLFLLFDFLVLMFLTTLIVLPVASFFAVVVLLQVATSWLAFFILLAMPQVGLLGKVGRDGCDLCAPGNGSSQATESFV